jgi:hypothetical protein
VEEGEGLCAYSFRRGGFLDLLQRYKILLILFRRGKEPSHFEGISIRTLLLSRRNI